MQRGYSLNFVSGAEVDIDPGELTNFFLLQIPARGLAGVTCGNDTALASPGWSRSCYRRRRRRGCAGPMGDKPIVLIERESLQHQCEQLAGRAVGKVEFATAVDTTSPAGRAARSGQADDGSRRGRHRRV